MATTTKRNALTGNPEFDDRPPSPDGTMHGATAPEGSAERLREGISVPLGEWSPTIEGDGSGEALPEVSPITVTDYDANGEAIDVPVREDLILANPVTINGDGQAELPGIPQAPDIWPRFMGRKVLGMTFAFSGKHVADATDEYVQGLARRFDFGQPIVATIHAQIANIAYLGDGMGPVDGVAKLKIGWVEWGAGEDEAAELRERIQAALTKLEDVRYAFASLPTDSIGALLIAEVFDILNGEGADDLQWIEATDDEAPDTDASNDDEESGAEEEPSELAKSLAEAGVS